MAKKAKAGAKVAVPDHNSRASNQDPLHGVTLKLLLTRLVEKYGWKELGNRININCFTNEPGIASSLKFLRKTPWARKEVEALYLKTEWPPGSF